MSKTQVWENDRHEIQWQVTSSDGAVVLPPTGVRLIAKPTTGGTAVDLACETAGDIVTHQLDGELSPGRYQLVIEAPEGTNLITYPDAEHGAALLVVKEDIG